MEHCPDVDYRLDGMGWLPDRSIDQHWVKGTAVNRTQSQVPHNDQRPIDVEETRYRCMNVLRIRRSGT